MGYTLIAPARDEAETTMASTTSSISAYAVIKASDVMAVGDRRFGGLRCNAPDEIGAIVSSPDPKGLLP
jgi:hypothetical protein